MIACGRALPDAMTIEHTGHHANMSPPPPRSGPTMSDGDDPVRPTVRVGRSYTRFVTLMKVLLPLLALGLMALLAAWPRLSGTEQDGVRPRDTGDLEMMKAHYLGTDKDNRPFSVTADRAMQSSNEPGVLDLVRPEAEMTMQDGSWALIKAERGRYNDTTGKLLLLGKADLFHDKGYEFLTDEVHVDVSEGIAWGDRPVVGQGPFGELKAEGFRLFDHGATIVFTGRSHLDLVGSGGAGQVTP
jgi:lipopolysaccharide export system protein LptC